MNLATVLDQWNLELKRSLRQSRSFCVAVFSLQGQVMFANEAFTQLVASYDVSNFINPTFDQFKRSDQGGVCVFDGILTLNSGKVLNTSIEAQVYRKEEQLLIVGGANSLELLDHNIKLYDLNREVAGLERQLIKKNNNLSHLLADIEDKNTALSQLISDKDLFMQIMAHDLRGPIGSVLGLSEILSEKFSEFSPSRVEVMLETIYKSLDSTFRLLNDLLLWSKAQAGNLPFDPTVLSAKDILEEKMRLYSQNSKSIVIQCDISSCQEFSADKRMLKTILRNLISNALKFTPEGGQITVSIVPDDGGIVCSVKDTGVGMSQEVMDHLFDFTKRHTTLGTQGEKGTGFGLQLCYDFVKAHGGDIWVKSQKGSGTTFYFSIPQNPS